MYRNYVKRLCDIILSLLAIILLSWLFLIVAILVRVKLGSPVLYTPKRPGKIDEKTGREKLYKLYKFRSMTNQRDASGKLLPDKDRLTRFGRMMRSTSLDELPELFNILKGDMSIVGPRPLAIEYIPYYSSIERKRHSIRPGLTGLAQISGRNSLSWEEKIRYDLQYEKEITFANDFRIIVGTVNKVLKRDGIGQGEEAPVSLHVLRADWLEKNGIMKQEYEMKLAQFYSNPHI